MLEFILRPVIAHSNYDPVGLIPMMLSEDNPRPATEQLNQNYQHGGGWRPLAGFKFDPDTKTIKYEGDPPMRFLAAARLRDEVIMIFPHAWVLILQPDGSYEISRMD